MKKWFKQVREIWHRDMTPHLGKYDLQIDAIYSFCMNQIMIRQGIPIEHMEYYPIHQRLNIKEVVTPGSTLKRVGGGGDGGYIMLYPYSNTKIAYSFGISNDVSWDLQMSENGYEVYQYDHTIEKLPIENKAFHWKRQGLTGGIETPELKQLATLIKENGHESQSGMVLKMDIEGYEWEVFSNIDTKILKQFDQITLEMHNLLSFRRNPVILKAIDKIISTHQTIYVHANNCGRVDLCGTLVTPDFLEVTFVLREKYEFKESEFVLPTLIDEPNISEYPEIRLGRWNV